MSPFDSRTFRLVACAFALALPVLLGSCSSSSGKVKGVPARLPVIDLHGSSSTPSHSMARSEYPFDSSGNYVTAWAAEGETRAGRGTATSSDFSGWRSSHHDDESSTPLRKPQKISATPATKSKATGTATASTKSKATGTASSSKKSSSRHAVGKGDTLSSIARKYGTSVSKLKAANGLKSDVIRDGSSLTIPR